MSGLIDYPAVRETLTKQTTACNLSATSLVYGQRQKTHVIAFLYANYENYAHKIASDDNS